MERPAARIGLLASTTATAAETPPRTQILPAVGARSSAEEATRRFSPKASDLRRGKGAGGLESLSAVVSRPPAPEWEISEIPTPWWQRRSQQLPGPSRRRTCGRRLPFAGRLSGPPCGGAVVGCEEGEHERSGDGEPQVGD